MLHFLFIQVKGYGIKNVKRVRKNCWKNKLKQIVRKNSSFEANIYYYIIYQF